MPPEQWTRIQDLFLAASEIPASERDAFLDREAGDQRAVRSAVESLLMASDHTGGFITRALGQAAVSAVEGPSPQPGDRFGAYEWKRALGEGGMGSVFLAERADGAYHKQVAIKVIRAGLATHGARERFLSERQILAQLEHPNIARLLEGGETASGMPYVVMEYVDGEPIDDYCRKRHLGFEQRIALFRQVCAGVSYAHQNLVVHRDLKPDNILVTPEGVPKLVDFGIARFLESPDGALTRAGDRALTPNYASPEQVLGRHITPASDVFSLGVLLYELLTGKVPVDLSGAVPSRIEAAICSEEPPPPSNIDCPDAKRMRGDVDRIVAKAMRKEPSLRYESVDALAADLGRFLSGFPVLARPLSIGYQSRKFVTRNRWSVAAGVLLAVAGVLFVTALIRERDTANRERAKAEQVAKLLTASFRAASPYEARGRTVTARDILDRGSLLIETELRAEPDVQATLMRTIGLVYSSIAEYGRARQLVQKAADVRSRAAPHVQPGEVVRDAAAAGGIIFSAGDERDGLRRLEEALAMQQRLAPRDSNLRASVTLDLGEAYFGLQKYADAERVLRESIDIRESLRQDEELPAAYGKLAKVYEARGDYERAIPLITQALEVEIRTYGEVYPSIPTRYNTLASAYSNMGRHSDAIPYAEKAVAVQRKLSGDAHPSLAGFLSGLGITYTRAGRLQESLRSHQEALAIWQKFDGLKEQQITGLSNVATAYQSLGQHPQNLNLLREALALSRELKTSGRARANLTNNWGVALRQNGQLNEALDMIQQALAKWRELLPDDHVNVGHVRRNLALALIDLGRYADAESLIRAAQNVQRKKLPAGYWSLSWDDALLSECRLAQNDGVAARPLAEAATAALEKANHPTASTALVALGRVHLANEEYAAAAEVLRRGVEIERRPSNFHDPFSRAFAEAALARALRHLGRTSEAEPLELQQQWCSARSVLILVCARN